MKLETKNLDLLTATVIGNLPADLPGRKRVLVTLHATLPRYYRRRDEIAIMIKNLKDHERHQTQFTALLLGQSDSAE
jgi:hypothetical protein